jgi:hypothetical protein
MEEPEPDPTVPIAQCSVCGRNFNILSLVSAPCAPGRLLSLSRVVRLTGRTLLRFFFFFKSSFPPKSTCLSTLMPAKTRKDMRKDHRKCSETRQVRRDQIAHGRPRGQAQNRHRRHRCGCGAFPASRTLCRTLCRMDSMSAPVCREFLLRCRLRCRAGGRQKGRLARKEGAACLGAAHGPAGVCRNREGAVCMHASCTKAFGDR